MKKFGILCLALVMALGALGVGYAAWTDTVFITGTVSTGEACVEFVPRLASSDPCTNPANPGDPNWVSLDETAGPCFSGGLTYPIEPKDVACTTVTKTADDTVEVVITNGYPCYAVEVTLHAENCGTVPMIAKAVVLTYTDATGTEQSITLTDGGCYYIDGVTQYEYPDDWGHVLQLMWVNNTGTQREPGGIWEDSLLIHVLQPANQNDSYSFTITREYIQWDEYGS